tara:strand:+ start:763 stop:1356 length:594 start_codon:yes stop_codon:yes gene_type:complete
MGRKITVIDASLRSWYTPDIDDNRKDPDPFMVLLSPLSGKDMRQLRSSLKLNSVSLENDDLIQAAEKREEELKALVVAQHVHRVSGYIAQDAATGAVTEPSNGSELVECVLGAHPDELAVLVDVYEAILRGSSLSDDAKKKQNLQSDSQSAGTQEDKHGVAQNAGVQSFPVKTVSGDSAIVTVIPTSEVLESSGLQS